MTYYMLPFYNGNIDEWSIAVAIVAQWQSTGGHNQLSWVQFPALPSFVFYL